MKHKLSIFWFRRDLRLEDNVGLYHALKNSTSVLPLFIFDEHILEKLPKNDARVDFIQENLANINDELKETFDSSIAVYHGSPEVIFKQLLEEFPVDAVYTNHDYEPYARERDESIKTILSARKVEFRTFKDQVIFEKDEIVKKDGQPYVVYTPYMRAWKAKFRADMLEKFEIHKFGNHFIKDTELPWITLDDLGFSPSQQKIASFDVSPNLIQSYEETRNFPALDATSKLGPHLRFGTISIRQMVKKAIAEENEIFWNELIWREFFMQILWHFPHTKDQAFKSKYDRIQWRNDERDFKAWCEGKTGYPLVDAGMRELNATGFMHNRIRMLTGSFLCKHLLIDWRWGEAYFAEKLHDYEMASNVGNWQWVAGSGVDASPYFRIFNPTTQIKKFDKDLAYIKKWVPEFQELTYPKEIVDHKFARERCLKVYKEAVS